MFDEQTKHDLLQRVPYGLYVCGVTSGSAGGRAEELDAFTLTWMTQTSFQPPLVAIAVRRMSHANSLIRESKVFSINFLGASQREIAEHFKKPADGKSRLENQRFHAGVTGSPILDDAAGAIECTVVQIVEHGDHDLILGEVFATERGPRDEKPLYLHETAWEYGG